MALKQEHHGPIVDIIQRIPEIPESCQWGIFLRNHDELTLEMVTDEERDYMYKAYARDPEMKLNMGIRRRLVPLLDKDMRKVHLLYALLFTLPGAPVIYYGDEIGMGDNVFLGDRNGVRTPMQWNDNRNAGFSSCQPSRLYAPVSADADYNYHAVNAEAQENLSSSLLHWLKDFIRLRRQYPILSRGKFSFLYPDNKRILVFTLGYEDGYMLCVFNMAASPQPVEVALQEFSGYLPVEIFGGAAFPRIGDWPYLLTLGPYGYYIFNLVRE
jgi:maltose alpha-D-glucosyltransferase/alpha-amylase